MSKKTTLAAGTSPFAHLLGGAVALAGRTLGKKAEEETPIDEEGPTNEDDVVDEVEDVEEPGEGAKKGKKAKGKAAESDEDDDDQKPDADADDKDDVDAESEDDKEQAAYQRGLAMGRAREGKRCSRIFLAAGAAGRPDLAATLAFTTRNTSAEAERLMSVAGGAPARRGATLDDRMAARTEPRPGAGGGQGGEATFGQRVAAAVAKTGRKA